MGGGDQTAAPFCRAPAGETYQRRDCGDTNHSLSRGEAEGRVTDGGLDRQANFLLRIHQEATNSGGFVGPPSHLLLLPPPPPAVDRLELLDGLDLHKSLTFHTITSRSPSCARRGASVARLPAIVC